MKRQDRYRSFDEELSDVATSLIEWFPPVRLGHHQATGGGTGGGNGAGGGPVISTSRNRRSASPSSDPNSSGATTALVGSSSIQDVTVAQQHHQPSGGSTFQAIVSSTSRFPAVLLPRKWLWWRSADDEGTRSRILASVGSSVQLGSQGHVGASFLAELACIVPRFGSLVARAETLQTGPHNVTFESSSPEGHARATLLLDTMHAAHNAFVTFFPSQQQRSSQREGSEHVQAPLDKRKRFISDVTVGYGVLVKRNLGANLLTGIAARVGERVTVQAHGDALRRLCCSVTESGIFFPNLDLALRLRMNLISFERTEFDFAVAYKHFAAAGSTTTTTTTTTSAGIRPSHQDRRHQPDVTVHASWSSAGVAAGVSFPSLLRAQHLTISGGSPSPPQWSWMRHLLEHVTSITVGVVAATDRSRSTQFFATIAAE